MPFYQRSWNVALGEPAIKSGRKIRKVPPGEKSKAVPAPVINVDASMVGQVREALAGQVELLKASKCATPIKGDDNFLNYILQKDHPIFEGKYSSIFPCFNHQALEMSMVCRIYQPKSMIVPENDMYLKVLRKLGTASPYIISTVDLYADEGRHVYVFQEYANRGNAYDYLKSGQNNLTEQQVCKWAQFIYQALDFIGCQGITHRSIHPKHLLIVTAPNGEDIAKLGSFRDAVIYFDPVTNDIIDQPCKPLAKRQSYPFQAPEVFGSEGEFFNPVDADVYSFGATLFYLAGRAFPYNITSPESNLDEAIQKNVANSHLSDDAKYCLFGLMRANTDLRTAFDALVSDAWLQSKYPPA